MRASRLVLPLLALIGAGVLGIAQATDATYAPGATVIEVTLKDHQFSPAEIHVPAGQPAILHITNQDASAEEFDSHILAVEKLIAGGHDRTVRLGPLHKGRYSYMGEYHPATAEGVVVVD